MSSIVCLYAQCVWWMAGHHWCPTAPRTMWLVCVYLCRLGTGLIRTIEIRDQLRVEFNLPKPARGGSPLQLHGDASAGTVTISVPQPLLAPVEARAKLLMGLVPASYGAPMGSAPCGCASCPWRWGGGGSSAGAGAGAGPSAACRNRVAGRSMTTTTFEERMTLLRQHSSPAEIIAKLGKCSLWGAQAASTTLLRMLSLSRMSLSS